MYMLARYYSDFYVTRGILCAPRGYTICHTLELPWKDNIRNLSCIPVGVYDVVKSESAKFGSVFRVQSVKDREGILFHVGNSLKDTRGCILPGLDVSDSGLLLSRFAMDRLLHVLPSSFQLTIKES